MAKRKTKNSFISGLIIILCILLILPATSAILKLTKKDFVLASQDLSYNGEVIEVLPDTISIERFGSISELEVVWDTENFDNQKVGVQRVYAIFSDDSNYTKFNIRDIYIDINVLSHSINSTVSTGLVYTLINDRAEYAVTQYNGADLDIVIPAEYKGKPVTAIKSSVFSGIDLTSLEFPASIKEIRDGAFGENPSLRTINFLGRIDQWCEIDFRNTYSTPVRMTNQLYINGELLTDVKLTTATKIGAYAFYSCKSLKSIEISETVTSIGDYAFRFCTALEEITIPDSVTYLGQYAFDGCTALESVTLSNNITSLESHLFKDCSALKSLEIPRSVTNIGDMVFYNTTSLESIFIPNTVVTMGNGLENGVFVRCSVTFVIYCEAESEPIGWSIGWNFNERDVFWDCSGVDSE